MNKKSKNLKIVSVFLVIFILLFAAAAFVLVLGKNKMDEYEAQIADMSAQLSANKQFVYVAIEDLTAGAVVEEGVNVELQENVTALPADMYMQYEDLGKILTVDVPAYMPIMATMVTDEIFANDTREVEVGVATLMLDQAINDYVDIRVLFPDGSDYIVVPKVKVKSLSLENNLFYTNMEEDEIITLASATIDAYMVTGTKIYITRYVEQNLQEEAIANYPVRQETLALMASDPNILKRAEQTLNAQARAELEGRLAMLSEDQLNAVNAGHGLTDVAHNQAFVGLQQNSVTIYEDPNAVATDGTEATDATGTVDATEGVQE